MKYLFFIICVIVLFHFSILHAQNAALMGGKGNAKRPHPQGAFQSICAPKAAAILTLPLVPDLPPSSTTATPRPATIASISTNRPTPSPTSTQSPAFRPLCSCAEGQCGCCTGVILDRFNQKACVNITYEPDEFALTAAMTMNGRVLFKRTMSGKNPPPMCVRLPRLPFVRFCARLSNIYFASRNVHFCLDMEANWEDLTLLEWSFDCIRMGSSGVAVVRPEEGGGLPGNPIDAVDQTDEDYDDSARNAPLTKKRHHPSTIIFDGSVEGLRELRPDMALIKVSRLPNGDVFLARNHS